MMTSLLDSEFSNDNREELLHSRRTNLWLLMFTWTVDCYYLH